MYVCIHRYKNILYIHTSHTHPYVRSYVRTYVYTYMHTYIHTYVDTYINTYINTYIHTYIHKPTFCAYTYGRSVFIHKYGEAYTHKMSLLAGSGMTRHRRQLQTHLRSSDASACTQLAVSRRPDSRTQPACTLGTRRQRTLKLRGSIWSFLVAVPWLMGTRNTARVLMRGA